MNDFFYLTESNYLDYNLISFYSNLKKTKIILLLMQNIIINGMLHFRNLHIFNIKKNRIYLQYSKSTIF